MKKVLSVIKYTLLVLCVLSFVSLFFLGQDGGTNVMLIWTYILLGLTLAVSVLFPIVNLVQNPKAAVRSLIGLVVVVIVLGISYVMSNADPMTLSDGKVFTDVASLRITDVGLYTTYFALGAVAIVILFGEIRNSIK